MKRRLLIFDIDDTLFDWLSMWSQSFYPFLESTIVASKVAPGDAKSRLRRFHQSVGTSEYPFTGNEVQNLFPELSASDSSSLATDLEDRRRAGHVTFSGVPDLLRRIQDDGNVIVLHTDAPPVLAELRIQALEIQGFAAFVYSTVGPRLPRSLVECRRNPIHRIVDIKKPHSGALRKILSDLACEAVDALYVGDSLYRDIAMAQACGVANIHARYGCNRESDAYNLLRDVSHWTEDDVREEKQLQSAGTIVPMFAVDSVAGLAENVCHPVRSEI